MKIWQLEIFLPVKISATVCPPAFTPPTFTPQTFTPLEITP
jgi:hypothetical protein